MAEKPASEPTAKSCSLARRIAQNRGIFRWFRGEFEQLDTGESRSVAWRGGESGIRTHGTVSRTHAFQACALSHSAISPDGLS